MKKTLLQLVLIGIFLSNSQSIFAEVVSIDMPNSGIFRSNKPVMSLYFQGSKPKALIIFLAGGWGRIGIRSNTRTLTDPFSKMLIGLTNSKLSSDNYDVVFMDTPYELYTIPQRDSNEHMERIEATAAYYKKRTNLPVWLMGHSNGALSVSSFVGYAQEKNRMDLIDGVIISGGRNETWFSPPLSIPVLFIHHEEDACINTQPRHTYAAYENLKKFDASLVSYIYIEGGEYDYSDPCTSGYHVYQGAENEAQAAIDGFLGRLYDSRR